VIEFGYCNHYFTINQLLSGIDPNSNQAPKKDTINDIRKLIYGYFSDEDENTRTMAAICYGPFTKLLNTKEDLDDLMNNLFNEENNKEVVHASIIAIGSIFRNRPELYKEYKSKIISKLVGCKNSDDILIKQSVARVIVRLFSINIDDESKDILIHLLLNLINSYPAEVIATALHSLKIISKKYQEKIYPMFMVDIVEGIFDKAKDKKAIKIKYAAEKVLMYLFEYNHTTALLDEYLNGIDDQKKSKDLGDYFGRVISKLEESDEDYENSII